MLDHHLESFLQIAEPLFELFVFILQPLHGFDHDLHYWLFFILLCFFRHLFPFQLAVNSHYLSGLESSLFQCNLTNTCSALRRFFFFMFRSI